MFINVLELLKQELCPSQLWLANEKLLAPRSPYKFISRI